MAGIANISIGERPGALPSLRAPASSPGPVRPGPPMGGLAARRMKANVPKLSPHDVPGGLHLPPVGAGPQGAGLGVGRPQLDDEPRRPSQDTFGTPFSNFSKIVYVFLDPCLLVGGVAHHRYLWVGMHPERSISVGRLYCTRKASISATGRRSRSICHSLYWRMSSGKEHMVRSGKCCISPPTSPWL